MDRLISAEHFSQRLVSASKYWDGELADEHDKGVAQGLLEADEKLVGEPTIQAIPLDRVKQAREEIESLMESIVGEYNSYTPERQMPSRKIERNSGRQDALDILDKLISEVDNG